MYLCKDTHACVPRYVTIKRRYQFESRGHGRGWRQGTWRDLMGEREEEK